MNTKSLDMLERAFSAEVSGAMAGHDGTLFSRSKLAVDLEEEGYLSAVAGCKNRFRLTELGRLTYCMSDRCAVPAAVFTAVPDEEL